MGNKEILKAIGVALAAHDGQVDKGGTAYALHPLRVMFALADMNPDVPAEAKIAAVLHDVVEDTYVTVADIEQQFGATVAGLVKLLTKVPFEPNDDYYNRLKTNKLAAWIMLADLRDNLDESRLNGLTEKDRQRIARYQAREIELAEILK